MSAPGMTPLHAKAREVLGQVFRISHGDGMDRVPWDDSDLHELKDLSDAAGGDYQLKGREAVDLLSQIRERLRAGHLDRDIVARTAAILDNLATSAENQGL